VVFASILLFLSPSRIFTYLKGRHPKQLIDKLEGLLKTRYKINRLRHNIRFLQDCISNYVAPSGLHQ